MSSKIDFIRNEVYPLTVLIYGRPGSQETILVTDRLEELNIPFEVVDIDEDEDAGRYVEHINHGLRTTPTIVFGDEDFIIVEPTFNELLQALRRAGYEV